MKRGSVGTKRKQTLPVSKSAARRFRVQIKTKGAGAANKKSRKPRVARTLRSQTKAKLPAVKPPRRMVKKTGRAKIQAKLKRTKRSQTKTAKSARVKTKSRKVVAKRRLTQGRSQARMVRSTRRVARQKLPNFLMEDDALEFSGAAGGLTAGSQTGQTAPALPESYGTRKLYLTVRDPHWLHAHWDLPREEQFRYNARSMDRHLVLRVHGAAPATSPVAEYHVNPESKYWFVHVEVADAVYRVELGYYRSGRRWKSLFFSTSQRTPAAQMAADSTVRFAKFPGPVTRAETKPVMNRRPTKSHALEAALTKIRPRPRPFALIQPQREWDEQQEQALMEYLSSTPAIASLLMGFSNPTSWADWATSFGSSGISSTATTSWSRAV